ncbi:hypothetical protein [Streptomyces sp. NPDC029674]|uniref:hypothetical protein n=1 Tax=Streptomyces sp. NPDC029674 TaxID=3365297 RepID=UPI00384BBEE7
MTMPLLLTRFSDRVTRNFVLGWTCQGNGGCGATDNADTDDACGCCGRAWG